MLNFLDKVREYSFPYIRLHCGCISNAELGSIGLQYLVRFIIFQSTLLKTQIKIQFSGKSVVFVFPKLGPNPKWAMH